MRLAAGITTCFSAALVIACFSPALAAQSLESRITNARDGTVRLSYATRAGVCGDGHNTVAYGRTMFIWPNTETHGHWSGVRCEPGAARVEVTVRDRQVIAARTRVGGTWSESSDDAATDLGTVSAPRAADALLSLAERADGSRVGRELLIGAVIADSSDIAPRLLRLARSDDRSRDLRRQSVFWYATLAEPAEASRELSSLARDGGMDRAVREAAFVGLAELPDGAGVNALNDVATRDGSNELRGKAAFWLGQVDDPRGHQALRTLIASSDTPESVNEQAIFALSQGDPTSDDVRFLEQQERRFSSEKLKDKVFFSLSQMHDDRAARWLLDVAGDENETTHARKQALFWAGQGGVSIGDLTRVYRASTNDDVKQQIIFVLSQRNEPAAIDALISIARDDSNREMRKKALFWLGQKDDPRVTKFLTDIISR